MNQELLELLMRSTPAEARQRLNLSSHDLDAQLLQLSANLNGQIDSPERLALLAYVNRRMDEAFTEPGGGTPPLNLTPELEGLRQWVCRHYRSQQQQYHTPEFLEWARSTFDEEVHLAGLREIEATGGVDIKDLLYDLDQEDTPRE